MMKLSEKTKSNMRDWSIGVAIAIGILLFFSSLITPYYLQCQLENFARYGDWMSGVSAILIQSAVVVLVFITFLKEKQQTDILKAEAALKNFSDTFFQLLQRYDAAVGELKNLDNPRYYGRRVFKDIIGEVFVSEKNEQVVLDLSKLKRLTVYTDDWLRAINIIVKHIENDGDIVVTAKKFYLDIFRGYFSKEEGQVLLAQLIARPVGSTTAGFLLENDFFKYAIGTEPFDVELMRQAKEKHLG